MTNKGIVLLTVMMIAAGGAVFASGQKDEDDRDFSPRGRGYSSEQDCDCFDEDVELITLTGTVDFTASGTILMVDGEEWNLMYPSRGLDMEIEEGSVVAVSGIEIEEPRRQTDDEDLKYLHVVSAEINGETYELDYDERGRAGGPGMRGGRPMGRRQKR